MSAWPKTEPNRFGYMVVIATDQFRGRLYRCPCGKQVWSGWGNALNHARSCPKAQEYPG